MATTEEEEISTATCPLSAHGPDVASSWPATTPTKASSWKTLRSKNTGRKCPGRSTKKNKDIRLAPNIYHTHDEFYTNVSEAVKEALREDEYLGWKATDSAFAESVEYIQEQRIEKMLTDIGGKRALVVVGINRRPSMGNLQRRRERHRVLQGIPNLAPEEETLT